MRKHLLLALCCGLLCATATSLFGQNRPIDGLAHRILGDQDTNFIFVYQPDTVDYFLIEPIHPKLKLFSFDYYCKKTIFICFI